MAIKIKEKVNKISNEISEFLNPDISLIPFLPDYELKIKTNEEVKKEQILFIKDTHQILSPISGIVAGAKKAILFNGEECPCILIQNDFTESVVKRKAVRRKINNITLDEIVSSLKEYGTPNLYRNNEYLFSLFENKYYENLIISGVDLEPTFYSDSFATKMFFDEILEIADILINSLNISNCYLVLRNNDDDNIMKCNEYLGAFPKIKLKLINPTYPNGLEHLIKKEVLNTKESFDKSLFLGVQNVIGIYEAIKRNRPISEKFITITGPLVKSPKVIKVKIGSYIADIIKNNIELISNDNIVYYANGILSGIDINLYNLFVSPIASGLYISTKKEIISHSCINCGKCYELCPLGVNPRYIMDNIEDIELIRKSKIELCINCGLCTYNCPSKIELNKYIKRGKNEIN